MKEFLIFIKENWKLLLEAAILIGSLVFLIVKKRPVKVVDTLKEFGLRLLPYLINEAENTSYKGEDKKEFVFAHLIQAFVDAGYEASVISQDKVFWFDMIEAILSTPQKKER